MALSSSVNPIRLNLAQAGIRLTMCSGQRPTRGTLPAMLVARLVALLRHLQQARYGWRTGLIMAGRCERQPHIVASSAFGQARVVRGVVAF